VQIPNISGYEILDVLGRGGMGVVYKARHLALKRVVALKMILGGRYVGTDKLARFQTEAEAVARLEHSHIVHIYDFGSHDGLPFLALEYVDGGTLDKKLAATPQDPRYAAAIVRSLAAAMQVAHDAGIIHRDLKPSNILLTKDGDPKITDFGLAKQVDTDAHHTETGAVMGTPSYMSPEQATGRLESVSTGSDVYALGAILYETLTGRPPFKAASAMETIRQVIDDEPIAPRLILRGVPADLETISLKCLQKDIGKRYVSAVALADDLQRYLVGEPIAARPIGRIERMWRWCKRKPAMAAAGAAVFMGILVAFVTLIVAFIIVRDAADQEYSQRVKAETLAETNAGLADANAQLALKERKAHLASQALAKSHEELAIMESKARREADERRELAEQLLLRIRFEHLSTQAKDDPALALVAAAELLSEASKLRSPDLSKSLRLHLGRWSNDISQRRPVEIREHEILEKIDSLTFTGSLDFPALSPDGSTVMTGYLDKTATFYDARTGKPIGTPVNHQGVIWAISISGDGKLALTAGSNAKLWDVINGKQIGPTLRHGKSTLIKAARISSDGKIAVTAAQDRSCLFWNTSSGSQIGAMVQLNDIPSHVALSSDGKIMVAVCGYTAGAWETATGNRIGSAILHNEGKYPHILSAAISGDGKTLLTGGRDGTARLWNIESGRSLGPRLQHYGEVVSVSLSADGQIALTGSKDGAARMWNTKTGLSIGGPIRHDGATHVSLSADGRVFLTRSSNRYAQPRKSLVRIWDSPTFLQAGAPLSHKDPVQSLALSRDGRVALTRTIRGNVNLWDTRTATLVDENRLDLGLDGKIIRCTLDESDPKSPYVFATSEKAVVSPNGKVLLIAADNKTDVWDIATAKQIEQAFAQLNRITSVSLSADGDIALAGLADHRALAWNVSTGALVGKTMALGTRAYAKGEIVHSSLVALSGDGKIAFGVGGGPTACVWNVRDGDLIGPPIEHFYIYALAINSDGTIAITADADDSVRLWETATGKQLGAPLVRKCQIRTIAVSADGRIALGGGYDKLGRLWNLPRPLTGTPEQIRVWTQAITGLEPNGQGGIRLMSHASWTQRVAQLKEIGSPWGTPP
jgi:WD40 repeat protein